jgi:hypothetical protein
MGGPGSGRVGKDSLNLENKWLFRIKDEEDEFGVTIPSKKGWKQLLGLDEE